MAADDVIGGCVQNRSCEQNANAKACLQAKLMAFCLLSCNSCGISLDKLILDQLRILFDCIILHSHHLPA